MAQQPKSGREVIAHFSMATLWAVFSCWLAISALGVWLAYDALFAHPNADKIRYGLNVWGFAILGVALIKLIALFIRTIRAAVASHGAALWIEDRRLRHADKAVLDVEAREVKAVELVRAAIYGTASFWPPHMVYMAVRCGDGKEFKVSTSGFAENRDDVVVALRERLGIAAHDVVLEQGVL